MIKSERIPIFCLAALLTFVPVGRSQVATPRSLYARVPSISSAKAPLVLRYKIRQYDPRTKTYFQVNPEKIFHASDEIVLEIEATDDSYLYVLNVDLSHKITWILPAPGEDNHLKTRIPIRVPAHKNLFFETEGPGQETLFFLLSRKPQ